METGDKLARGAKKASFEVRGEAEFLHDMKVMRSEQVMEKYAISEETYREHLATLERGEKIENPPVPPGLRVVSNEPGQVKFADGSKVEIKVPETPKYSAEARGDNVLVTRVDNEHSSQLIIPPSAKAKSDIGRVVAIGPEVERCSVGELVLFDRFAAHGKEIELVDTQGIARLHLLLNDADILLGLQRYQSVQ